MSFSDRLRHRFPPKTKQQRLWRGHRAPFGERVPFREFFIGGTLYTSTALIHSIQCPGCQLNQFPAKNGQCRRCHHPLGISYLEFSLSGSRASSGGEHKGPLRTVIARTLRNLRSRRSFTQELLSRYARISRGQLSRYECGRARPSLPTLLHIAAILGIDHLIVRARDKGPGH